jgi:hypothetical protein
MPEGLLSAIHLVLQTRESRIAALNATYPKALRAAINSTLRVTAGIGTSPADLWVRGLAAVTISKATGERPLPLSSDRHARG